MDCYSCFGCEDKKTVLELSFVEAVIFYQALVTIKSYVNVEEQKVLLQLMYESLRQQLVSFPYEVEYENYLKAGQV